MAETATVGELLVRIRADVSQLEAGLRTANTGITTFGAHAVIATGSSRRLNNALRGIGVAAAGLPGPIGRVMNQLLNFAPGGVVGAAVIGGLGAIALMWVKVREEAKKAAEEEQKTFNLLRNLRVERIQGLIQGTFPEKTEADRLRAELAIIRATGLRPELQIFSPAMLKQMQEAALARGKPLQIFTPEALRNIDAGLAALGRIHQAEQAIINQELKWNELIANRAIAMRNLAKEEFVKFLVRAGQMAPIQGGMPTRLQLPGGLQPGQPIPTVPGGQIGGLSARFADRIGEMAKITAVKFDTMTDEMQRSIATTIMAFGSMTAAVIAAFQGKASFWQMLGSLAQSIGFIVAMGNPIAGAAVAAGGTIIGQIDAGRQSSRAMSPGVGLGVTVDFSTAPPASNPMASARDREIQQWFREVSRVAASHGFRG